jgi:proline dehydrogenase
LTRTPAAREHRTPAADIYRGWELLGYPTETGFRRKFSEPGRNLISKRFDRIRHRRSTPYRAGPGLDHALAVCRRLARYGLPTTIGYSAAPGERALDVAGVHRRAFEALAADDLDSYVSVKLSALGFDARLFRELALVAAQAGRRLHVDALAPDTADRTWRLLEAAPQTEMLGATLPGRWRRSADDAARAIDLGLTIRIVKGQWAAGGAGTVDATEGFLDVVDRLSGQAAGVAVATHAAELLAESLRRLTTARTPCEAELLNGLPFRAPTMVARELGVPVRVYVAYGDVSAPYGVGDVIGNRVVAWWLAQDLLFGKDKTWRDIRWLHTHP